MLSLVMSGRGDIRIQELCRFQRLQTEARYYFKVREANGDYFVEEGLKESKKALADILKKS